jgi:hypothetical protein
MMATAFRAHNLLSYAPPPELEEARAEVDKDIERALTALTVSLNSALAAATSASSAPTAVAADQASAAANELLPYKRHKAPA